MIRTTIIPVTTNVYLSIPKEYIGKKVEVLLYTIEESEPSPSVGTSGKKPSDFFGTLSREDGEKMQAYITNSRNEWERNI